MAECIKRESANEFVCQICDTSEGTFCVRCDGNPLKSIPAADVVEVRYCVFTLEEARRRESVYKCSACGNYMTVRADTLNGGRGDMNYCPFCGRKVKHGGQTDV